MKFSQAALSARTPAHPDRCCVSRRRLLFGLALAPLCIARAEPDLDRMQRLARQRYGEQAARRVAAWRELVADSQGLDERTQLGRVNTFFNRSIRYVEDIDNRGQGDYWASPLETMGQGAGDCEDFTIAKYRTLQLLGVPTERMRLIYVRARIGGPQSDLSRAHMVLGYYPAPASEPLILDSLIGEIRPAGRRPDLTPVFSFNSGGLWVGDASESAADPTAHLSRWRSVLERMREEGLK